MDSSIKIAHYITRIQDTDDWMIDPCLFMSVDMMWGPHTIDCFASACSRQQEKFILVSRHTYYGYFHD